MNDKQKITAIYFGVGVLAVVLISAFVLISHVADREIEATKHVDEEYVQMQLNTDQMETIGKYSYADVTEGFVARNQDGEEVNLMELKGKTWVFAQFYGSCPDCYRVNFDILQQLNQKYGNREGFHIVTMGVKKFKDPVKIMHTVAKSLGVETSRWWFLSADLDAVNAYCQKQLLYMSFQKRDHSEESLQVGEIEHDMGIAVIGPDMKMWGKVDIFSPSVREDELAVALAKKKLQATIDWCLNKTEEKK